MAAMELPYKLFEKLAKIRVGQYCRQYSNTTNPIQIILCLLMLFENSNISRVKMTIRNDFKKDLKKLQVTSNASSK